MTDEQIKQLGQGIKDIDIRTLEEISDTLESRPLEEIVEHLLETRRDVKTLQELALAKNPEAEKLARLLRVAKDVSDLHELIHQYASHDLARAIGVPAARQFIHANVALDRALKEWT